MRKRIALKGIIMLEICNLSQALFVEKGVKMAYINDNFLFNNEKGKELFDAYVKDLPIYDYHCHLNPQEIAEDKKYKNITEVWLGGDHYKWRAMRINGIDEKYITGNADDLDKFKAFAKTLDQALGNPLYQWSHLELSRYFSIDSRLTEANAEKIYEEANRKLENISARSLILDSKVTHLNTTDDPCDDLKWHKAIKADSSFDVKVNPTFRPDPAFKPEQSGFKSWVEKLESVSKIDINDIDSFEKALVSRIDYFHSVGCRLADHGYEAFVYEKTGRNVADSIFKKALQGAAISIGEATEFKSYLTSFLANEYKERSWVMQMHLGALRNNNTSFYKLIGPDTGFDSMGDWNMASALNRYLDDLYVTGSLPRTIVYNLNNKDNDVFASMMGNYPRSNYPAYVNFGTAWWFYDQKDGIEKQLTSYANFGVLGRFAGMVTDSRSFLSYTRHEYFRRTACNLIGSWVENNMVPDDDDLLKKILQNICYYNAVAYFGK